MKKWFSVCAVLLLTSVAQADILPEDQWNEEVAVWLARAMVSEAGWKSQNDHAAIAWVLKRRWETRVDRDPEWTFLDQIKHYCTGMKGKASRRDRWVRDLSPDGSKPQGWPRNVSWETYLPAWNNAWDLANAWVEGEVKDPCPAADHWSAPRIRPSGNLRRVKCGGTQNVFYAER
jgi:hypothetical protein